jgi:threonine dehydrogenase-like Zn-dependent dehydrogenase
MIKIGDRVIVRIHCGAQFDGIVDYEPQATGDSWHIEEVDFAGNRTGIIHYVQTFAEIVKYPIV